MPTQKIASAAIVALKEALTNLYWYKGDLRSFLTSIGISVTQRVAGTTASRWIPLIGAVAVAGYAYFDTLQVAKTAAKLLEGTTQEDHLASGSTAQAENVPA